MHLAERQSGCSVMPTFNEEPMISTLNLLELEKGQVTGHVRWVSLGKSSVVPSYVT